MRLMLGTPNNPSLLVSVQEEHVDGSFDFHVVNGNWAGAYYTNGYISIDAPSGFYTSLDKVEILTSNQDRLRGSYNDVFANFHDVNYVAPNYEKYVAMDDDDIPF